jgi:simple sugar transport system ATP-binding protein
VLILDEPTAVLTPQEIDELITIMHGLIEQGKTIIIITHKLREIKAVGDRCTIIRRGNVVGTVNVDETSEQELASMMVGREVNLTVAKEPASPGEVSLRISDLRVNNSRDLPAVRGLSLEVRNGEILGIAGVDGNGQSELVEALVGVRHVESGTIEMNGVQIANLSPKEIFDNKISSIPEDRQRRGLVLEYTVGENMVLGTHTDPPFAKRGILQESEIRRNAEELIEQFDVRPPEPLYLAGSLSGGNQQKVIIAREVSHDPEVLIASQPTRGLDVGAIEYVHRSLVDQRDRGKAVLLVSLDLDEVMNVSDRIAVIFEGEIVGVFNAGEVDEHQLGLLMAGGTLD